MKPVLVDTDVLVDYLRGDPRAVSFIEIFAERIILSSFVVAELFAGAEGDGEQAKLDDFVSLFPVLPVTREIARAGGLHRGRYGRSHGTSLADGIIAATAETEGAELKTLAPGRYPMFKDLEPAYRKS